MGRFMQPTASLLEQALAHYQRGDLAAAETLLARLPDNPSALHLSGLLKFRQGRIAESLDLLAQSVAMRPGEAQAQFNYGKILAAVGRHPEAADALEAAIAADPAHAEAVFLLGKSRQAMGQLNQAIECYGRFLQKRPNHVGGKIALGSALLAASRTADGIALLAQMLEETEDPRLCADLHHLLATAYRRQFNYAAALQHLEQTARLDPSRSGLAEDRAALFEAMQRFSDAKSVYEEVLASQPVSAKIHRHYNDLLYRLEAEDQFLTSYDRAPRTKELLLDKAQFLLSADRWEDAQSCFRLVLSRYGDDKTATLGLGLALLKGGRISDAIAILEEAAQRYQQAVDIHCNVAAARAQAGEPDRAMAAVRTALGIDPYNQVALGLLGTCLRLMQDERDEELSGYDKFVRVFDLDPPAGFTDMSSFNTELGAELNALHPPTREYLRQSLRGGTQTSDNLFDSSSSLIGKLRIRIEEAVAKYISQLSGPSDHPLLARRGKGFGFAGSWSSRLHDRGYHINHLHPGGWISSCYYLEVPKVAQNEAQRQGWIKFGEPSFDVGLKARRAIQPVPGRLILFPSYMWHGTEPFRDNCSRTTIAFDVIPA